MVVLFLSRWISINKPKLEKGIFFDFLGTNFTWYAKEAQSAEATTAY